MKTPPDGNELLSTQVLAERWAISTDKVRAIAHSGELPFQKIGHRTLRFRLVDVEAYEAKHRQTK